MNSLSEAHWTALKCLICYLKGTQNKCLFFSNDTALALSYYTGSDWGGDVDDRHSTSGYGVFLGSSLIS